jgi:hypothetical protein
MIRRGKGAEAEEAEVVRVLFAIPKLEDSLEAATRRVIDRVDLKVHPTG